MILANSAHAPAAPKSALSLSMLPNDASMALLSSADGPLLSPGLPITCQKNVWFQWPGRAHDMHSETCHRRTTTVVPDGRGNGVWNLARAHSLVEGEQIQARKLRRLFQGSVEVVDVRLMVLGVVNLHGHGVHKGLQRIIRVGKGGQRVRCHLGRQAGGLGMLV